MQFFTSQTLQGNTSSPTFLFLSASPMASSSLSLSSELFNQESEETIIKYRECWRNHAVLIGGYAADGCGEFIPKGDQGTKEGLICEACDCHRNFHRKELIKNGVALLGSHHFPPMWWGESNAVGFHPSALPQAPLPLYRHHHYHHRHHYSQNKGQDTVSDEESVTCIESQAAMEMKALKRTKTATL